MTRVRRTTVGGLCYHVINRGNRKARVFYDDADYRRFTLLMTRACRRIRIRVLAWCLMPNHFHFVIWPKEDGDLSRWMQWLLTSHVRQHHLRYETSGRIWQGRFKAFPIQHDAHLLTVLRYVERNPLRASLVSRAENWPWSSLRYWLTERRPEFLQEGPQVRPVNWCDYVNLPQTPAELEALRGSSQSQSPFGDDTWVLATVQRLGLEWTLRKPGRQPGQLDLGHRPPQTPA